MATVDDYIWAFLQVVAYYQLLKDGIGGDGPNKEELKLRGAQCRAQRTGDPIVLQKVLLDMPGGKEFFTRDPHLEGAEVFGSQKRRPDTPIGDDGETHRHDTVNFSRPPPVSESLDLNQKHYLLSLRSLSPLYKRFKCLHLQDLVSVVSPPCKKPK